MERQRRVPSAKTRADQVRRGFLDRTRDDVPFWELEYDKDQSKPDRADPPPPSQPRIKRRSA